MPLGVGASGAWRLRPSCHVAGSGRCVSVFLQWFCVLAYFVASASLPGVRRTFQRWDQVGTCADWRRVAWVGDLRPGTSFVDAACDSPARPVAADRHRA